MPEVEDEVRWGRSGLVGRRFLVRGGGSFSTRCWAESSEYLDILCDGFHCLSEDMDQYFVLFYMYKSLN